MKANLSEKRILLSWAAFFGMMYVPFAAALEFWMEVIEDEVMTDVLAFVFLSATSYFAFRLVVKRIAQVQPEDSERKGQLPCSAQIAEPK